MAPAADHVPRLVDFAASETAMLSDPQRLGLRLLAGDLYEAIGKRCAEVSSRIRRCASFRDYAQSDLPNRFMPFDVAIESDQYLIARGAEPMFIPAAARLIGKVLVDAPLPPDEKQRRADYVDMARESGEALAAVGLLVGRPKRREAETRKAISEIDRAVRAALEMRAVLQLDLEDGDA
jgi:hypothetical protein